MNPEAAAKLKKIHVETLQLVYERKEVKEIAQILSRRNPDDPISHHGVKERLRDARAALGVSTSREAAELLMAPPGPSGTPGVYHPPEALPLDARIPSQASRDEERLVGPAVAQELRDRGNHQYDPFPPLLPRRWHHWLLRRRGERFNDLTALQTITAIIVLLTLMALSALLIMAAMSTWP